ncbi:MAG: 16S rRNA (uracil(1498)-N(3))-methyltransferase [Pyrinomonadaceae bacterium]|nr:16S rRNA (uracil(1498)-N(3))-methyltransferase [Pyrinomonadaceae bacterium]
MSRRRFYAPPEAFTLASQTVMLAADEARHLRDVLRLERGAEVFVFDGRGREYRCVVDECSRSAVKLEVAEEVEAARRESPLSLRLAVALLKGEKFDLVVQKATELGVTEIVPLITRQADVRLRDAGDGERRTARWQRIALEAAKQSGRALVPFIASPCLFSSLIEEDADGEEWRVMFTEREGHGLLEMIDGKRANVLSATALVGPEGGWTDEEIAQARAANWSLVTLGGRILRAETAAITVTALLEHLFGDIK